MWRLSRGMPYDSTPPPEHLQLTRNGCGVITKNRPAGRENELPAHELQELPIHAPWSQTSRRNIVSCLGCVCGALTAAMANPTRVHTSGLERSRRHAVDRTNKQRLIAIHPRTLALHADEPRIAPPCACLGTLASPSSLNDTSTPPPLSG